MSIFRKAALQLGAWFQRLSSKLNRFGLKHILSRGELEYDFQDDYTSKPMTLNDVLSTETPFARKADSYQLQVTFCEKAEFNPSSGRISTGLSPK